MPTQINKIITIVFCVLFMIVLCVPLVAHVTKTAPKPIQLVENRELSRKPQWASLSVLEWPAATELWLKDNLAFRSQLLWLYIDWWTCGLKAPRSRYVAGKDGHLFPFGPEAPTVQNALGMNPLSRRQILEYTQGFLGTMAYCRLQGVPYLLILAPDKASFSPELLPDWAQWRQGVSWNTQLVEALKKTPLPLVDMTAILKQHPERKYFNKKFDTWHWNGHALDLTYKEINRFLVRHFPSLSLEELDNSYKIVTETCIQDQWLEDVPLIRHPLVTALQNKAEQFVALGKMYPTHFYASDRVNSPKLLCLSDSYFYATQGVLPQALLMKEYVHIPAGAATVSVVDKIFQISKPDVVIEEIVERMFRFYPRLTDPWIRMLADTLLCPPGHVLTPNMVRASTLAVAGGELRDEGDSVVMESNSEDPQLELRPVTLDKDGRAAVMLRMNVAIPDNAELLYAEKDEPYTGAKVLGQALTEGDNILHFQVFGTPGATVRFRFGPGMKNSRYVFRPIPELARLTEQTASMSYGF